jgi:hypothetical protein
MKHGVRASNRRTPLKAQSLITRFFLEFAEKGQDFSIFEKTMPAILT